MDVMSFSLAYEVARARLDDELRQAAEWRMALQAARAAHESQPVHAGMLGWGVRLANATMLLGRLFRLSRIR